MSNEAPFNHEQFTYWLHDKIAEMEHTKEQVYAFKVKADKWDALGAKIEKCYCNADGEYDEDNPEIEDADLCTIGEMAASAFGWL
jgi:hypothetical protein